MKTTGGLARLSADRRRILMNRGASGMESLLRVVFLFCMCFVVLYPILYMVSVSLRGTEDLYDPTVIWIPKAVTLDN